MISAAFSGCIPVVREHQERRGESGDALPVARTSEAAYNL